MKIPLENPHTPKITPDLNPIRKLSLKQEEKLKNKQNLQCLKGMVLNIRYKMLNLKKKVQKEKRNS